MPAVHICSNAIALVLATGAFSAAALPAVSGDWKSSYFFSSDSQAPDGSLGNAANSTHGLAFSADRDYGRLVLGGSYSRGSILQNPGFGDLAGSERLSLRAGYDFGQSLGYISVGRHLGLEGEGSDKTDTLGIGVRVSLNRALQLTGEYLHHAPSVSGATHGQSPSRISIGAAFQF